MLELIGQVLEHEGYDVLTAESAHYTMALLKTELPDLFIIDVMLPVMDGLTLCHHLRRDPRTKNLPIVFIADEDSPYEISDALDAGGDDYIVKPFAVRELKARLRAHLRRVATTSDDEVSMVRISDDSRIILVDGREVELTQVEHELLTYLCHAPNRLHSTQDLLINVWQYPEDAGDAALVRNHIRNLRRKLESSPERPEIIQSRHGRGYTIKAHIEFVDERSVRYA
jgi:DNA-binding response OmpR family regulator